MYRELSNCETAVCNNVSGMTYYTENRTKRYIQVFLLLQTRFRYDVPTEEERERVCGERGERGSVERVTHWCSYSHVDCEGGERMDRRSTQYFMRAFLYKSLAGSILCILHLNFGNKLNWYQWRCCISRGWYTQNNFWKVWLYREQGTLQWWCTVCWEKCWVERTVLSAMW